MVKILLNGLFLSWSFGVLVHSANSSHPGMEGGNASMPSLSSMNTSYLSADALSNSDSRCSVCQGSGGSGYNRLSCMQTGCEPLDLLCKMGIRKSSSYSGTYTQVSGSSDAKRAHEEEERTDGGKNVDKRQRVKTKALKVNASLMDKTEACLVIEEFNRYFEGNAKVVSCMQQGMLELANDLAQRGLSSLHSREIIENCTASEKWLGGYVFWKMLLLFVDALSLDLTISNRLEDKKTVVLRVRRIREKSLSKHTDRHIYKTISKCRDAERMEIECNLSFMEEKGAENVLAVLRWLLYHVKIECVGIACDLTEAGMNSEVFERQLATLTQEWKGSRVRIDSLALRFSLAQYKEAAEIVKEYSSIPVLKIHFIDVSLLQDDDINQALETLLLNCSGVEQLSVFGAIIDTTHIRTITAMLPQLVFLKVESLTSECQKEEEESMPVFSGLKTLKISTEYKFSGIDIKKLVCLFPNLQTIQMPAKYVSYSRLDALSKLSHFRSLETVNGLLLIETVEYLLETLPTLECLAVEVHKLNNNLAQVLSKYVGMHTLKLRGKYTSGFLASLLRPSPLMSTLRVLEIYRYSIDTTNSFTLEDQRSRQEAMKKFGCMVQIIYD
ncbi:hypothetical protein NECID01_0081 [Nematocida sp. AWRm77]|nr:hypothetical protein NECID01_0081 [Nematocida sp. AWRm77]